MEPAFWHEKWRKNEIGFHLDTPNPLLVENLKVLELSTGSRLLLPLCGKTLDIDWLLSKGYQVIGVELSKLAVEQLFERLGYVPEITRHGSFEKYTAPCLTVYVGDLFDLTPYLCGQVDAIYDRAALVALPVSMREKYSQHLAALTETASHLLVTFEYDQSCMPGPPFSISDAELDSYYSQYYSLHLLFQQEVEGGLKGCCPATEKVWLLSAST